MKITKIERIILAISAVALIAIGIPLTALGYIAGWVSLAFGVVNYAICVFSERK